MLQPRRYIKVFCAFKLLSSVQSAVYGYNHGVPPCFNQALDFKSHVQMCPSLMQW